jgi:G3E family GTPase
MGRDSLISKLPVTIISGFLGSGKTTLISKLVRHPAMNRVAVIINEIGEIGIDHDLVSMSSENVSLLSNGCLCCSVRSDLQETLRSLYSDRRAGRIPDFDRVVLETTGLADPAPVIQTLSTDMMLVAQFRFDGLVTLIDGVHGTETLAAQTEAVKQVSLADKLLITKSDLTNSSHLLKLKELLVSLNPQASQQMVTQGVIDPSEILQLGLSTRQASEAYRRLFNSSIDEHESSDPGGEYNGRYLGLSPKRHPSGIETFSLTFTEPFKWDAFSAALELLTSMRGSDLLRVKGIVNVDGRPFVIQGVQHIFHPSIELDGWPSKNQNSRIVFIARRLRPDSIRALFEASRNLQTPLSED